MSSREQPRQRSGALACRYRRRTCARCWRCRRPTPSQQMARCTGTATWQWTCFRCGISC